MLNLAAAPTVLAVCACGLLLTASAPDARSAVLALAATAGLIVAATSVSSATVTSTAAVRHPSERFISGLDAAQAIRATSSDATGAGAMLRDLDAACVAYCKAITCDRGGPLVATHVSDYQLSRGAVLSGLAAAEVANLRRVRDRPAAVEAAVHPVLSLFGDFDAVLLERGLTHRRGPDAATAPRAGSPFGACPGS